MSERDCGFPRRCARGQRLRWWVLPVPRTPPSPYWANWADRVLFDWPSNSARRSSKRSSAIVHGARRGVAHMVSVERLGFLTHREPNDHGPRGGITWWYHVDQQHTPHLFPRVAEHERALVRSLSLSATHSNPRTRIELPFSLPRAFWPSPSPLRTGGGLG